MTHATIEDATEAARYIYTHPGPSHVVLFCDGHGLILGRIDVTLRDLPRAIGTSVHMGPTARVYVGRIAAKAEALCLHPEEHGTRAEIKILGRLMGYELADYLVIASDGSKHYSAAWEDEMPHA